jgi:hypothetical protein
MIKIKRLGCALVLIGITAVMVRSQDTAGDYAAPSEAVPRGKAPKMQVQLLTTEEPAKQYAVIFYQGDEAFSCDAAYGGNCAMPSRELMAPKNLRRFDLRRHPSSGSRARSFVLYW